MPWRGSLVLLWAIRATFLFRLSVPTMGKPLFLQAPMDEVLVVERLQFRRQQDRCHGAVFEGGGNAMHIIPTTDDHVSLDRLSAKERLQDAILAHPLYGVETLIGEVADARRELQALQIVEGIHQFGKS